MTVERSFRKKARLSHLETHYDDIPKCQILLLRRDSFEEKLHKLLSRALIQEMESDTLNYKN